MVKARANNSKKKGVQSPLFVLMVKSNLFVRLWRLHSMKREILVEAVVPRVAAIRAAFVRMLPIHVYNFTKRTDIN